MKSSSGRTNLRPPVGRLTFGGAARRRRRSSPDGASAIAGQPGHAICMITSRLAPALALAGLLSLALPAVARGAPSATADFDGDGHADLVVGAPVEDTSGHANTGVVHILYGGRRGLTTRDELLGQGFAGVPGTPEAEQNFGAALAAGDFDGDGRDDLAVGIPDDTVGGAPAAGAAVVMYSTRRGVVPGHDQV